MSKYLPLLIVGATVALGQASYAKETPTPTPPLLKKAVSSKQKIRFYKANRQLQADRILLTDEKSSSAGCQNFLKKVKVFKVVQIGFSSCTLYAKKDCPTDSSVGAASEDQAHQTTLLTEGVGWFPAGESERGATVKSWSCSQAVTDEQVVFEANLAANEMRRLAKVSSVAAEKAAAAQALADKANKSLAEASDNVARVKAYGVATGVLEPDPVKEEKESADSEQAQNQ